MTIKPELREIKFRMYVDGHMSKPANLNQMIIAFALSNRQLPLDGSVKLMQFTGLKDKNGKEIYEGDIVMYLDRDGADGRSGLSEGEIKKSVEWLSSGFWLQPEMYEYEIIGNMYDNPELLK